MKSIDEIKKENPFRVPDGYFESLTERTMSAVKDIPVSESLAPEKKEGKVRVMPFLALAAAIIGFAIIAAGMVRLVTRNAGGFPQVAHDGIYADLVTGEIDTYIIENEWAVSEEDTDNEPEVQESETEVQSEAIIDYLLLENVELTDIYELL
jgi:hypothetical protein